MPNVENVRFRWNVFIVELTKEEEIVKTRTSELKGDGVKNQQIFNYQIIKQLENKG